MWILNFSDSFFVDQLNSMNRNRFDPLTKVGFRETARIRQAILVDSNSLA